MSVNVEELYSLIGPHVKSTVSDFHTLKRSQLEQYVWDHLGMRPSDFQIFPFEEYVQNWETWRVPTIPLARLGGQDELKIVIGNLMTKIELVWEDNLEQRIELPMKTLLQVLGEMAPTQNPIQFKGIFLKLGNPFNNTLSWFPNAREFDIKAANSIAQAYMTYEYLLFRIASAPQFAWLKTRKFTMCNFQIDNIVGTCEFPFNLDPIKIWFHWKHEKKMPAKFPAFHFKYELPSDGADAEEIKANFMVFRESQCVICTMPRTLAITRMCFEQFYNRVEEIMFAMPPLTPKEIRMVNRQIHKRTHSSSEQTTPATKRRKRKE